MSSQVIKDKIWFNVFAVLGLVRVIPLKLVHQHKKGGALHKLPVLNELLVVEALKSNRPRPTSYSRGKCLRVNKNPINSMIAMI